MITGDKEYLDDLAKNYVCKDEGGALVVAWHAGEKSYVLRCGQGHFPEEVTRRLTPTQEFKQGKREPVGKSLDLLPKTDLATGEFLSPEVVQALMDYAHKYQLDPFRGHVVLMYSKPYITVDGYLYHAHRQHKPFTMSSRPVELTERTRYMIKEGDHAWLCEIRLTEKGQSFPGLGIVTQQEMAEMSKKDKTKLRSPVVAAHPWQLAQKRAEWQALRRAFPIGETEEEEKQ